MVAAQSVDIGKRRGSFTPGELSLLPEYCRDIQGTPTYDGEPGDRWRALMGSSFAHMHHYCRGLRDMHFARTTAGLPGAHRRFLWERSIDEFNYIVRNSPRDMVLIPEVFVKIGQSSLEIGRLYEAQLAFEEARKLKPDYWPAYTIWADRLVSLQKYQPARALLEEGLIHSPASQELKSRLNLLESNLSNRQANK
jgi:tetratricopeptide (TPR) repeat protein